MFSFEFLKLSTIVSVKLNKFLSYFVSHKVKEVNSTAEKQLNQAPNLKAHGTRTCIKRKKIVHGKFLIFVQENVSTIRFQEIKIRP